ncbi:MAG TPA: hypothetical protein VL966_07160 [Alphaproteobacteria bacterium]|nr:hypothetical protein [Alphaproteobacteria bacterium]
MQGLLPIARVDHGTVEIAEDAGAPPGEALADLGQHDAMGRAVQ